MGRHKAQGLREYPYDEATRQKLERFYALFHAAGRNFFYACLEEIFAAGEGLSLSNPITVPILAGRAFCSIEDWNAMLTAALDLDLFDLGFYEQQLVLTSSGVKARWETVAKKRLRSAEAYSSRKIAEPPSISVTEIISATDTPQKSSPSLPPPLPPLSPSPPITPSSSYTPDPSTLPPPLAPAKPGRKRNELFDAICAEFGIKAKSRGDGSRIGRAASELRAKGATPDELRVRVGRYRQEWPTIECTPEAVAKHWDRFGRKTGTGINGAVTDLAVLERNMLDVFNDLEANHGF